MKVGFVYTALRVRDLDESVGFYTEIFSMKIIIRKRVKETDGELCLLGLGRNRLELNWYNRSPVRRGGSLDHLAFEVKPFSAFLKFIGELRAKGIVIHEYLETTHWNRFFVEDPDHNWIEVFSRKRSR